MIDLDSPLHRAKEIIDIHDAWHRLVLPGSPGKSCKSPFREDRSPSFSVYDDGRKFKDHATGESGDVVSYVALACDVNLSDAAKVLIEWNGGHVSLWGRLNPKNKKPCSFLSRVFEKIVSSYTYQVWFRVACSGRVWVQVLHTYIATSQASALRLSLKSGFKLVDIRLCGESS